MIRSVHRREQLAERIGSTVDEPESEPFEPDPHPRKTGVAWALLAACCAVPAVLAYVWL